MRPAGGAIADLRRLLPLSAFRRLLGLRLLSQSADGVVQVALAAYVVFSPERQTTPGGVAAVTVATLLPFTLVGPFTGVVLDRWSRRDVLVGATVLRAGLALALAAALAAGGPDVVLFAVVVAGFGVNRFVLAGLSAALPHVVRRDQLLAANAVVPTAGTLAYVVGLGAGGAAQAVAGNAALVFAAAGCWVVAAAVGHGFGRPALGPDRDPALPPPGRAVRLVLRGLSAAASHLRDRPSAATAIGLVAGQRLCAALTLMAAVLLYRSTYAAPDDPAAGLAGLSVSVLAAGTGFLLAAVVTPWLVDRWSTRTAVTAGIAVGGCAQVGFAATLAEGALVVTALALGLGGQVLKICADTLVQREVQDRFRGRVFVLYDMAFNAGLIAAAGIGALVLPPSGRAAGVLTAVAAALLLLAAVSARPSAIPRTR